LQSVKAELRRELEASHANGSLERALAESQDPNLASSDISLIDPTDGSALVVSPEQQVAPPMAGADISLIELTDESALVVPPVQQVAPPVAVVDISLNEPMDNQQVSAADVAPDAMVEVPGESAKESQDTKLAEPLPNLDLSETPTVDLQRVKADLRREFEICQANGALDRIVKESQESKPADPLPNPVPSETPIVDLQRVRAELKRELEASHANGSLEKALAKSQDAKLADPLPNLDSSEPPTIDLQSVKAELRRELEASHANGSLERALAESQDPNLASSEKPTVDLQRVKAELRSELEASHDNGSLERALSESVGFPTNVVDDASRGAIAAASSEATSVPATSEDVTATQDPSKEPAPASSDVTSHAAPCEPPPAGSAKVDLPALRADIRRELEACHNNGTLETLLTDVSFSKDSSNMVAPPEAAQPLDQLALGQEPREASHPHVSATSIDASARDACEEELIVSADAQPTQPAMPPAPSQEMDAVTLPEAKPCDQFRLEIRNAMVSAVESGRLDALLVEELGRCGSLEAKPSGAPPGAVEVPVVATPPIGASEPVAVTTPPGSELSTTGVDAVKQHPTGETDLVETLKPSKDHSPISESTADLLPLVSGLQKDNQDLHNQINEIQKKMEALELVNNELKKKAQQS